MNSVLAMHMQERSAADAGRSSIAREDAQQTPITQREASAEFISTAASFSKRELSVPL